MASPITIRHQLLKLTFDPMFRMLCDPMTEGKQVADDSALAECLLLCGIDADTSRRTSRPNSSNW